MDIVVDIQVIKDYVQVKCQVDSKLSQVIIHFYKDDKLLDSDTILIGDIWQSSLQLKEEDVKPGQYICQAMFTTASFTLRTSFTPSGKLKYMNNIKQNIMLCICISNGTASQGTWDV